jgi:hypothetical protein
MELATETQPLQQLKVLMDTWLENSSKIMYFFVDNINNILHFMNE